MHKFLLKNRLEIQILGVNLKRLIKSLYKNKINIYNLTQPSFRELNIIINSSDYKKLRPMLKDYEFKIISRYGFEYLKEFTKKRIGLFFLVICFVLCLFFNYNFLSNINIYGTKQIDKNEIMQYLNSMGIKRNSFFTAIDPEQIEANLESKFDEISMISVIKKGTNLIVNIKEKIETENLILKSNIVAKESGKILEISTVQGTSKVSVGDIVKKGDVLIEGVINNDGKTSDCKAIGNVKMQVWYETSTTFMFKEKTYNRTGKKIVNSYYEIFNKRMKMKVKNNTFKNYEKETKTQYLFKNLLIPIKIYKEIYYEIEENLIKNDFSLQKDAIIDTIIKETENKVPSGVEKLNQKVDITDIENGKIITCYIETIQSFN